MARAKPGFLRTFALHAIHQLSFCPGFLTRYLVDEQLAELEEELLERSGEVEVYFRDPSGVVQPAEFWYPARTFWSIVRAKTLAALRQASCGGRTAA